MSKPEIRGMSDNMRAASQNRTTARINRREVRHSLERLPQPPLPPLLGPARGLSLGMLERARQIGIAVLTSGSACDLLAHYGEYCLSPSAIALYHTFELGAPIHRHAEPIDDDVADLVLAVACTQAPIDFERLNRLALPRPRAGAARDLAGDDRSVLIGSATGHSGATAAISVLQQPFAVGEDDKVLEQPQEFLLLSWGEHRPKPTENKATQAGDVEILAEQLAKSGQFPLRRGIAGHGPELAAEIVDECRWIGASCSPYRGQSRSADQDHSGGQQDTSQHSRHLRSL